MWKFAVNSAPSIKLLSDERLLSKLLVQTASTVSKREGQKLSFNCITFYTISLIVSGEKSKQNSQTSDDFEHLTHWINSVDNVNLICGLQTGENDHFQYLAISLIENFKKIDR